MSVFTVGGFTLSAPAPPPPVTPALPFSGPVFPKAGLDTYEQKTSMAEEDQPLKDIEYLDASHGTPIPRAWGTARVGSNCIWSENADGDHTRDTLSFAVGICAGPIDAVLKIWEAGCLIYDVTDQEDGNGAVTGPSRDIQIYLGTEHQIPNPLIEEFEGAGNVPAFRGLAYAVFRDHPTTGGNVPQLTFLVTTEFTPDPSCSQYGPVVGRIGQNPTRDIIYVKSGVGGEQGPIHAIDIYTNTMLYSATVPDDIGWWTILGGSANIDERGYIYANYTGYSGTPSSGILKMDAFGVPVAFGEVASGGAQPMAVVKNSNYPYLYYGNPTFGGRVCVTHRDLFRGVINGGSYCDTYYASHFGLSGGGPSFGHGNIRHSDGSCFLIWSDLSSYSELIRLSPDGSYESRSINAELGYVVANCWYIEITNEIAVHWTGNTVFYDADTLQINSRLDKEIYGSDVSGDGFAYRPSSSVPWTGVFQIDLLTKEVVKFDNYSLSCTLYNHTGSEWYDIKTNSLWHVEGVSTYSNNALVKIPLGIGDGGTIKLWMIVRDICLLCGLEETDIDVTELQDDVRGFVLDSRQTGRQGIEPLMQGFFFDGVESDGLLKFPKRGRATSAYIAEFELACYPNGGSRPEELTTVRKQEWELPISVDHTYVDIDRDYLDGLQRAIRMVPKTDNQLSLDLPIVFNADEGLTVAEKTLYNAWVERDSFTLSLSRKYAYLDPCDVVEVTEGGNTHKLRIESMSVKGGLIDAKCVAEDISVYTIVSSGYGGAPPGSVIPVIGNVVFYLVDSPLLNVNDDQFAPGLYVIGAGTGADFKGATVDLSIPSLGVSVDNLFTIPAGMVVGSVLSTTIGEFPHNILDEGTEINVSLIGSGASLSSITLTELLNGGNLASVGGEILQFQTVVHETDGTWTLSNLLRGRKGTDTVHANPGGEHFLLYDVANVDIASIPASALDMVGRLATFTASPIGSTATVQKSLTLEMAALKPYSVDHVDSSTPFSGTGTGSITVTWIRRTRLYGEWLDGVDVGLEEETESYDIEFYYGGALKRTKTVSAQEAAWTLAEQTTDGVSWSTVDANTLGLTFTTRIYQNSAAVGRGFVKETTHQLYRSS